MRRFITGVNAAGRSCVLEETDIVPSPVAGIPGFSNASLYTSATGPPARPGGNGAFVDLHMAPGAVRWMVVEHASPGTYGPQNFTAELHYADALYLICVLRGSIEMRLEDDVVQLEPGDCVVLPGVDHGYTAGAGGCRMLVAQVGTPPPA